MTIEQKTAKIYHICSRSISQAASAAGEYRADSLAKEGFIHFSQRHQVLPVARAFYAGQPDLVVLVVDPALLKAELKYEDPIPPLPADSAAKAGSQFPHLYGPLNFDAVVDIIELADFRE